jgi:sulfate transport system substrate-binding protein
LKPTGKSTGESINVNQSHGGSSKQARSVADGMEASVVTMNQANDIDILVERGVVAADWAKKFPNGAAPFYSTMVYLVRKGNPKQIKTGTTWPSRACKSSSRILKPPATAATPSWPRGARC